MTDLRLIYITAKDKAEARSIGRALVEEKLVACANILDGALSLYHWEGKIEEGKEVLLLAKTCAALVPKLTLRVKTLHSHKCPCIVTLPILEGNPEYLAWVEEQTA